MGLDLFSNRSFSKLSESPRPIIVSCTCLPRCRSTEVATIASPTPFVSKQSTHVN